MNQRDRIRMSTEEVATFLAGPHKLIVCTFDPSGAIHAVPMFYGLLDGDVAVHTYAKSQKVRNLGRDPRMTALVEVGTAYEELRGAELVGVAEVVEDPAMVFGLGVDMQRRYHGGYVEDDRPMLEQRLRGRVALRLRADRVVSWDHRKLADGVDRKAVD